MNPKICIIIPSHNLTDQLERCLNSIKRTNYDNIVVIIFDNGSTPSLKKSFLSYSQKFKHLMFLRSSQNLGFAQANNLSLKYALKKFPKTDYFLFLNNDAYVKKNFFTKTIPYLNQKSDLLSPVIELTNDRGVDSAGIDYYSDGTAINSNGYREKIEYLLPAASLFVSKKFVLECKNKFGWLFIPSFESYIEDVEFSLRALLMEKKIILINKRLVLHKKSSTFRNEDIALYLGIRNQLWTIIITWTKKMIYKNFFGVLRGQLINNIVYFLKFKSFFMFRIYFHTVIRLPELLRLRRKIQKYLIIDYPNGVFVKNPVTLKTHIIRSRTYKKLKILMKKLML